MFNWVMAVCCDLEVDVNGEETFMVDKVKKGKKNLFVLVFFSYNFASLEL